MPTRPPGTPDVDLTYDGASGTINGGIFQTPQVQPAGTGTFNTFVRIQHTGTEQGYNSDESSINDLPQINPIGSQAQQSSEED